VYPPIPTPLSRNQNSQWRVCHWLFSVPGELTLLIYIVLYTIDLFVLFAQDSLSPQKGKTMPQEDKLTVWKQKLIEMEHLQDGMGTGLDHGIKETVAVLQLLGVHTRQSCEGHMDHGVAAPWIFIETPDPRLEKLRQKYTKLSIQAEELEEEEADALYDELWALRGKMEGIVAVEYTKLIPYLEKFYQDRRVSYVRRLIIDQGGRLTCQGMILQPTEKKIPRRVRMQEYQAEMHAFTEYLKNIFFTDQSRNP
jgi:hypothetical protein